MKATKWVLILVLLIAGGAVLLMAIGGAEQTRGLGSEVPGPTGDVGLPDNSERTLPSRTRDTPIKPVLDGSTEASPGFSHDEAGARAAAVAYLETTEEAVNLDPAAAAALQREMATEEFADELAADTEQRMDHLRQTVPDGIVLRLASIEARSIADGDDWLVSIWYVQAITITGSNVVDDWRTVDYRLRWQSGTWKIAAIGSQRGPMPGRGSEPASETPYYFEEILTGYSDDGLA